MDSLLQSESSDEDSKEERDDASIQYYHHESGAFSQKDGSYRHRHPASPRPHLLRPSHQKRMSYSWSTPNLAVYSDAAPKRAPSFSDLAAKYMDRDFMRTVITADIPIFPNSSVICPHKHHCFQNAIMKGFFRTFSASFIFKTSLSFFTSLLSGKMSMAKIKRIFLNEDSILFGLFVGLMSFTYKAIL